MQTAIEGNGVSQLMYNVSEVTSTGYSLYSETLSIITTAQPHQLSTQNISQNNLQSTQKGVTI